MCVTWEVKTSVRRDKDDDYEVNVSYIPPWGYLVVTACTKDNYC